MANSLTDFFWNGGAKASTPSTPSTPQANTAGPTKQSFLENEAQKVSSSLLSTKDFRMEPKNIIQKVEYAKATEKTADFLASKFQGKSNLKQDAEWMSYPLDIRQKAWEKINDTSLTDIITQKYERAGAKAKDIQEAVKKPFELIGDFTSKKSKGVVDAVKRGVTDIGTSVKDNIDRVEQEALWDRTVKTEQLKTLRNNINTATEPYVKATVDGVVDAYQGFQEGRAKYMTQQPDWMSEAQFTSDKSSRQTKAQEILGANKGIDDWQKTATYGGVENLVRGAVKGVANIPVEIGEALATYSRPITEFYIDNLPFDEARKKDIQKRNYENYNKTLKAISSASDWLTPKENEGVAGQVGFGLGEWGAVSVAGEKFIASTVASFAPTLLSKAPRLIPEIGSILVTDTAYMEIRRKGEENTVSFMDEWITNAMFGLAGSAIFHGVGRIKDGIVAKEIIADELIKKGVAPEKAVEAVNALEKNGVVKDMQNMAERHIDDFKGIYAEKRTPQRADDFNISFGEKRMPRMSDDIFGSRNMTSQKPFNRVTTPKDIVERRAQTPLEKQAEEIVTRAKTEQEAVDEFVKEQEKFVDDKWVDGKYVKSKNKVLNELKEGSMKYLEKEKENKKIYKEIKMLTKYDVKSKRGDSFWINEEGRSRYVSNSDIKKIQAGEENVLSNIYKDKNRLYNEREDFFSSFNDKNKEEKYSILLKKDPVDMLEQGVKIDRNNVPKYVIENEILPSLRIFNKTTKKLRESQRRVASKINFEDVSGRFNKEKVKLHIIKDEKDYLYKIKDELINWLSENNYLKKDGYHIIGNEPFVLYTGKNNTSFHLPSTGEEIKGLKNLGEIEEIPFVRAKENLTVNEAENIIYNFFHDNSINSRNISVDYRDKVGIAYRYLSSTLENIDEIKTKSQLEQIIKDKWNAKNAKGDYISDPRKNPQYSAGKRPMQQGDVTEMAREKTAEPTETPPKEDQPKSQSQNNQSPYKKEESIKYAQDNISLQKSKRKEGEKTFFDALKDKYVKAREAIVDEFYRVETPFEDSANDIMKQSSLTDTQKGTAIKSLFGGDTEKMDVFLKTHGEDKLKEIYSEWVASSIRSTIDKRLRASSMAGQFIEDSGIPQTLKEVNALNLGGDSIDIFDQYLIARQNVNLTDNWKPRREALKKAIQDGKAKDEDVSSLEKRLEQMPENMEQMRDIAKDRALVESLPELEPHAQNITNASHKLLDYLVDTGMRGKAFVDNLKSIYPNYVPLKKIFSEKELGEISHNIKNSGIAGAGEDKIVQMIRGKKEGDIIESPLGSIIDNINIAYRQGETNRVATTMLDNIGVFGDDMKVLAPNETGINTISVWKEGEPVKVELSKELFESVKKLNNEEMNLYMQVANSVARVWKTGTTALYLPFTAVNVPMDVIGSFINSKKGVQFLSKIAGAMVEAITHGKQYDKLKRAGALTTSFDIFRENAIDSVEALKKNTSIANFAKYMLTGGGEVTIAGVSKTPFRLVGEALNVLENVIGRAEEMTRIALYNATEARYAKLGLSDEAVSMFAGIAARDTSANFLRGGNVKRMMNAFMNPYLNASIRGIAPFLQAVKDRPVQTLSKVMLGVGGMGIVSYELGKHFWGDNQYEKMISDVNEKEKENFFIIPYGSKLNYDEDLKVWSGDFFKLRVPNQIASLVGLTQKLYGNTFKENYAISIGDTAWDTVMDVSPVGDITNTNELIGNIVPQFIKGPIEVYFNRNAYYGTSILNPQQEKIAESLEYLKETDDKQYRQALELLSAKNTSKTAKLIGYNIGMAPKQVDVLIGSYMGRAILEPLQGKSPFAFRNIFELRGGEEEQAEWDKEKKDASMATVQSSLLKSFIKNGDEEQIQKLIEAKKLDTGEYPQQIVWNAFKDMYDLKPGGIDNYENIKTIKAMPDDKKALILGGYSQDALKGIKKWTIAEKHQNIDNIVDFRKTIGDDKATKAQLYSHMRKVEIIKGTKEEDIEAMPKGWDPTNGVLIKKSTPPEDKKTKALAKLRTLSPESQKKIADGLKSGKVTKEQVEKALLGD